LENECYVEVSIRANGQVTEALGNFLIEQGCGGFVLQESEPGRPVEFKVYVHAFSEADSLSIKVSKYLKSLRELDVSVGQEKIAVREIRKEDWERFWKRDIKPLPVGQRIIVKPSWDKAKFPGKMVIKIDPKMAFGTGRHETTRLCMEEMERLVQPDQRILDVGTGSGILAILAAKLGASHVLALDPDPIAADSARENIKKNKVEQIVEVRTGTIDRETPRRYFDLTVANLFKARIFELFDRIQKTLKDDGVSVLSGILDSERDEVSAFLKRKKARTEKISHEGGWLCYVARQIHPGSSSFQLDARSKRF